MQPVTFQALNLLSPSPQAKSLSSHFDTSTSWGCDSECTLEWVNLDLRTISIIFQPGRFSAQPTTHFLQIPDLILRINIILQYLKHFLLGTRTRNHRTTQHLQRLALLRDFFKQCSCSPSVPRILINFNRERGAHHPSAKTHYPYSASTPQNASFTSVVSPPPNS